MTRVTPASVGALVNFLCNVPNSSEVDCSLGCFSLPAIWLWCPFSFDVSPEPHHQMHLNISLPLDSPPSRRLPTPSPPLPYNLKLFCGDLLTCRNDMISRRDNFLCHRVTCTVLQVKFLGQYVSIASLFNFTVGKKQTESEKFFLHFLLHSICSWCPKLTHC